MGDNRKGYDVLNFLVEPVKEGFVCVECELILRDAVQTKDGSRVCYPCFKEIEKTPKGKGPKTGICYMEEDGELYCYPDKAVRREVQRLEMRCKFGCPWNGQLGFFEEHCKSCPKVPLTCEACNEQVTRDQIEDHKLKDCRENKVVCCCGAVLERRSSAVESPIDLHLKDAGTLFLHFGTLVHPLRSSTEIAVPK